MSTLDLSATGDTEDQALLREVVAGALTDRSAPSDVRRHGAAEGGYDPDLWRLAGELGWFGLESPEEFGGSAQTFAETAVVLEELGRRATPGPYLSHLVATGALLAGDGAAPDELRRIWGERLVTGECVAVPVPGPPVPSARRGAAVVLKADIELAVDVEYADLVLLPVALDGEPATLAVEPAAAGAEVVTRPAVDLTRRIGGLRCRGIEVPAAALAGPTLHRALADRGAVAVAIDALGCAEEVLRATVAYAAEREQFGRPIGTFQAVKHGCADMLVAVETARAAVRAAVRDVAAARSTLAIARAKAHACEAADFVVGRGLQLHGGYAFTWEYDLHLWIKRAKLDVALWGTPSDHRAAAARVLWQSAGDPAAG